MRYSYVYAIKDDEKIATVGSNKGNKLKVVINPVTTMLKFEFIKAQDIFGAAIFDMSVNLVVEKTTDLEKYEINVSQLATGVYFLKVSGKDGNKYVKEFIKI